MENQNQINLLNPELSVVILTWISFFLLLFILYKFAWHPILISLEKREETIRQSLENADRLKNELAKIEQVCLEEIVKAENKGKEIVEQSRKAAIELAQIIQNKTKEEIQILLENTQREIKAEQEKVLHFLRQESAHIAVTLAGKLIEENLDTEKNRKLVNRLIKQI